MSLPAFARGLLVVLLSGAMPAVAAADEPPQPQQVFLLIGQSNMAGRAALKGDDREPIEGVLLLNDKGEWEPAVNPLNRYSNVRKELRMQRLGPGDGFVRRLREASPDVTIGLIVNARGGTKIEEWARGKTLYDETIRRVRGVEDVKIAGVLWHQGEANRNDAGYAAKLEELVANLREDLGDPQLPFIAGQIAGEAVVNSQLAGLPDRVPRTACVSAADLTLFDTVHFDRDSQKELGRRYAEAYLSLVGSRP